jgi:hypothetical protein
VVANCVQGSSVRSPHIHLFIDTLYILICSPKQALNNITPTIKERKLLRLEKIANPHFASAKPLWRDFRGTSQVTHSLWLILLGSLSEVNVSHYNTKLSMPISVYFCHLFFFEQMVHELIPSKTRNVSAIFLF